MAVIAAERCAAVVIGEERMESELRQKKETMVSGGGGSETLVRVEVRVPEGERFCGSGGIAD